MAKVTKAQIERSWKKDLGNLGFISEKGVFTREKPGAIRELIGVQRNAWQPTFKLLMQICIFDEFLPQPESRLCLSGHLRQDGVYLRENEGSWWPESEVPGAGATIVRYGIPWLESFSKWETISQLLERSIAERKKVETIIEPKVQLKDSSDSFLRTAFPPAPVDAPVAPPTYSCFLSLVYHATNQFEKGCRHAQAWLQHVSKPGWKMPHEPERTQRLMRAMHCAGT